MTPRSTLVTGPRTNAAPTDNQTASLITEIRYSKSIADAFVVGGFISFYYHCFHMLARDEPKGDLRVQEAKEKASGGWVAGPWHWRGVFCSTQVS